MIVDDSNVPHFQTEDESKGQADKGSVRCCLPSTAEYWRSVRKCIGPFALALSRYSSVLPNPKFRVLHCASEHSDGSAIRVRPCTFEQKRTPMLSNSCEATRLLNA